MKTKKVEEIMKKYEGKEFSETQMRQIRKGFEKGLTIEQISLYAKSEYDHM